MSCIITKNPHVEALSARLLREPDFRDGTLTLYADVPVKCIRYTHPYHICRSNLCSDRERYANEVIDFVVCHGETILLCICFDAHESQHCAMFQNYLHGLDYIRHHFLELEHDAMEQLYTNVMEKLHFFTDCRLSSYRYALVPVEVSDDLPGLQSKRLLCEDTMSILYTRDCGLFVRCFLSPEGSVLREPLTSDAMSDICFQALNWVPEENYCTDDLRNLLEKPLEAFFSMHKDSLHFLEKNFQLAKRLQDICADRGFTTYGDCLALLAAMQTELPQVTGKERESLCAMQKAVVSALCQVASQWYIPLFQLPLAHYFTAAANLSGCFYPIWLFRNRISPHLCSRPKDCFAVSEFVQICMPHILSGQHPAASMALIELLLAPICK